MRSTSDHYMTNKSCTTDIKCNKCHSQSNRIKSDINFVAKNSTVHKGPAKNAASKIRHTKWHQKRENDWNWLAVPINFEIKIQCPFFFARLPTCVLARSNCQTILLRQIYTSYNDLHSLTRQFISTPLFAYQWANERKRKKWREQTNWCVIKQCELLLFINSMKTKTTPIACVRVRGMFVYCIHFYNGNDDDCDNFYLYLYINKTSRNRS